MLVALLVKDQPTSGQAGRHRRSTAESEGDPSPPFSRAPPPTPSTPTDRRQGRLLPSPLPPHKRRLTRKPPPQAQTHHHQFNRDPTQPPRTHSHRLRLPDLPPRAPSVRVRPAAGRAAMTAKGGAAPSPGGAGAAAGNGRLFTVGLVTAWYSSNIGVLLLNKYLLSNYGFKYPIFLTMCHMSACALLSYAAIAWLRVVPMQLVRSRVQLAKIAALSLVFCGSVVSGNVSLRYLPVSFNQAVGATTPFFTAVFAYIITVKRESWVTYLTLVPVVTGVIIASGGEPSFHLFGFIMCIGATAARALKTVLQGILLSSEGEKLNSMNLLLYMAPIAVILLLPATIFMEDNVVGVTIQLAKKDFTIVWLLLFNSCLAYFVNLTNFLVTKHTSALTLQVLGNAKGAVAVVVSIMIFRNPVSITGMLGYTLTVIGVILYSESKKHSSKP